jgi:hypothetical protein
MVFPKRRGNWCEETNISKYLSPTHGLPQIPSLIEKSLKAICNPYNGAYLNKITHARGTSIKTYNCQSCLILYIFLSEMIFAKIKLLNAVTQGLKPLCKCPGNITFQTELSHRQNYTTDFIGLFCPEI